MSFAYPLYFWLAGAAALTVVGLHYLTTMQQRPAAFPTTRFIPEQQVRHSTVSPRFSDLMLMLLRMVALLLLGLALAQPRISVTHVPSARIVVVDLSSSVRRDTAWRREVEEAMAGAAAVVAFDSVAWASDSSSVAESLGVASGVPTVGRLSPSLVEALRAAHRLREKSDSLQLVLLTPLVTGSTDEGTLAIRAQWPGAIRVVRAPLADWPTATAPTIEWADSASSRLWMQRARVDTSTGVHSPDATLLARFPRRWSLRSEAAESVRIVARWLDGEPAMLEQSSPAGCVRSLGFSLPSEGDAVFRPEFDRFLVSLRGPCLHSRRPVALSAAVQLALSGSGGSIAAVSLPDMVPRMAPLTPWLLLLATVILVAEFWARRSGTEKGVEG